MTGTMIILDTNVVSELLRPQPEPRVEAWLAAREYARIGAERRAAGRPVSPFDCQIAAIGRARGAAVATRNGRDFEGCGLKIIDPWHDR